MVKYLLVVAGGLIFLAGYSFMKKNEGSGKTMRIYALFAYAGLSLIILAGARVLDPVFAQMGSWADNIQLAVQAACFVIGAEVLLKPGSHLLCIAITKNCYNKRSCRTNRS